MSSCGGTKPILTSAIAPSNKHIQSKDSTNSPSGGEIPQASMRAVTLQPPKPSTKIETYSVVVTNVPAQEILFALARDAKINVDITPGLQGNVTINAIDQTLPQILDRIAKQVDMRYEINNGILAVMPDSPYLKTYKIDYVNMSRDSDGSISNATQIGAGGAGGAGAAGNNSRLAITNSSKNRFWERLEGNIKDILRETDKILPEGSSETVVQQNTNTSTTGTGAQPTPGGRKPVVAKGGIENSPNAAVIEGEGTTVTRRNTFREAASVISNPESGIITVRATSRQHEKIQDFVSQIMANSRRQVLIEATIVEVTLNSNYKQGIDWGSIRMGTSGLQMTQVGTGLTPTTAAAGSLIVNYQSVGAGAAGNIGTNISLLSTFGDTKVLSSPKISVMNNQTAVLRVVDNQVYFIVNATTVPGVSGSAPITTYTTTVNTVPVGFTMSVTPQISENNSVLLNVRPSITRVLTSKQDPTPNLAVANFIPQVSTREMESMLRIESNQIAIMGGLMEDKVDNNSSEIPLFGRIPFLGNLFKSRNDSTTKTELVIFLRPVVINDASIEGDFSQFRDSLPTADFFNNSGTKQATSQEKQKP